MPFDGSKYSTTGFNGIKYSTEQPAINSSAQENILRNAWEDIKSIPEGMQEAGAAIQTPEGTWDIIKSLGGTLERYGKGILGAPNAFVNPNSPQAQETRQAWQYQEQHPLNDPLNLASMIMPFKGFIGPKPIELVAPEIRAKAMSNIVSGEPLPKEIATQKPVMFLGSESGNVLNIPQEIVNGTKKIIDEYKTLPEIQKGTTDIRQALGKHLDLIKDAGFNAMKARELDKVMVPDPARRFAINNAIEHQLKGMAWDELNPAEKKYAKDVYLQRNLVDEFNFKNDIVKPLTKEQTLARLQENLKTAEKPEDKVIIQSAIDRINGSGWRHVTHQWLNKYTGEPNPIEYGKFNTATPLGKTRTIADLQMGKELGLNISNMGPMELAAREHESLMRADATRRTRQVLEWTPGETGVMIDRGQGPQQIQMAEKWSPLQRQGLTSDYKKLDIGGDLYGVQKDLAPWVENYIKDPNYGTLSKLNFVSKSLVLGFNFFHGIGLMFQDIRMGHNPALDIYRGIKQGKMALDATDKVLYRQGGDWYGQNYEDVGPTKKFFEGQGPITGRLSNIGNVISWPVQQIRDFTFKTVRENLKRTMARSIYEGKLADAQKAGLTQDQWGREVVKRVDSLFSGEDAKRGMLESGQFMQKLYWNATSKKVWQASMISPTWQREHLLDAKRIMQSVLPDVVTRKVGMAEQMSPLIKGQYRKGLYGAIALMGAADLYNYMMTLNMDGKGTHLWNNPKGYMFSVRAPWNNPDGRQVYFRPFKSIVEIPEAVISTAQGDASKFTGKLSAWIQGAAHQIKPNYGEFQGGKEGTRLAREGKSPTLPVVIKKYSERAAAFAQDTGMPFSLGSIGPVVQGKEKPVQIVTDIIGLSTNSPKLRKVARR
jgi:hypothetical protein